MMPTVVLVSHAFNFYLGCDDKVDDNSWCVYGYANSSFKIYSFGHMGLKVENQHVDCNDFIL
jgi:hypothetical protein